MPVLGIDVCLGNCSVALLRERDAVLATRSEAMARGHVERLAPMVAEVLDEAGVSAGSLDMIGVTCGPGGFTGARLGAAFARGLALAGGCRAVGITTLEALAFAHGPERLVVALDGRRGDLFIQLFDGQQARGGALALPVAEFPDFLKCHDNPRVIGPDDVPGIDPADVARLALLREGEGPPRPLYLRAPDAKAAQRPVLR